MLRREEVPVAADHRLQDEAQRVDRAEDEHLVRLPVDRRHVLVQVRDQSVNDKNIEGCQAHREEPEDGEVPAVGRLVCWVGVSIECLLHQFLLGLYWLLYTTSLIGHENYFEPRPLSN